MDQIETHMTPEQRAVYQEDKTLGDLKRRACEDDAAVSRLAMQELRKVFYAKKHGLEAQQLLPQDARDYGLIGRATNIMRDIVALFNDQGWGLHERRGVAVAASTRGPAPQLAVQGLAGQDVGTHPPHAASTYQRQAKTDTSRTYQGLGKE
jgi:hypothetical protein